MKFLDFDLNLQVFRYLGVRFGKVKFFGLAKAYVKPLGIIKTEVLAVRNEAVQLLSYSISTIVIEKMLNDKFDKIERRIYIGDPPGKTIIQAVARRIDEWDNSDSPPADNLVCRTIAEINANDDDVDAMYRYEEVGENVAFRVVVNNDIAFNQDELIKAVNRYRTCGKTWSIYNTTTSLEIRITTFSETE
jgi:hypothetical protein